MSVPVHVHVLATFHRVRNQRWLKATPGSAASEEMGRRLHRGGPEALNVYFSKPSPGPASGPILGWSSFPWDARGNLKQDGVTINVESMPGGVHSGYNCGDTVVHEVGHWLGLYHTFQGGCSTQNDLVQDTPRERGRFQVTVSCSERGASRLSRTGALRFRSRRRARCRDRW